MANRNEILKAVRAKRAGLDNADDGAVMTIFNSLDEATQKEYLKENPKSGRDKNADRTGPTGDV